MKNTFQSQFWDVAKVGRIKTAWSKDKLFIKNLIQNVVAHPKLIGK